MNISEIQAHLEAADQRRKAALRQVAECREQVARNPRTTTRDALAAAQVEHHHAVQAYEDARLAHRLAVEGESTRNAAERERLELQPTTAARREELRRTARIPGDFRRPLGQSPEDWLAAKKKREGIL
jgi:hypothetical protein